MPIKTRPVLLSLAIAATLAALPSVGCAQAVPGSAPDASTGLESTAPTTQRADFIPAPITPEAASFPAVPGSGVRWKENAFGISFEVPLNATPGLRPAGDSQVVVAGPGGDYMIDFILRSADTRPMGFDFLSEGVDRRPGENPDGGPKYQNHKTRLKFAVDNRSLDEKRRNDDSLGLDIDTVVQVALKQMTDVRPTAVVIDTRQVTIAKRPAAVIYFKIPADTTFANSGAGGKATVGKMLDKAVMENNKSTTPVRRSDWVLAQAFMMIDPSTVAVFQLDCEYANYADIRPKFEGLLASVEKEPFDQIDKRRKGLIERGDLFLKSIKPAQIRAAMVDEQWFSIVKDKTPVGWMKVSQKPEQRGKIKGYRSDVQYRLIQGDRAADMLANYFTSEDGNTEYWSSQTAVRSARERKAAPVPAKPVVAKPVAGDKGLPPKGDNAPSWVESGVLSNGKIIVTRESPISKIEVAYEQPGKGFLPTMQGMLTEQLLPREASGEWGFYAYEPRSGEVAFRTVRVQSSPDGSRRVYTRASPSSIELISEFNAEGKLIRKTLAGGLELVPATKVQLGALWNIPVN